MRLVIDSNGTIINADQFARELGPLPASVSVIDYVVKTIGFVWVDVVETGCRVFLHPDKVEPATETALFYALVEERPQRVLVSFAVGAGQHRIFASASAAVEGISTMICDRRQRRSRRFASRPVDLGTLQGFPSLQRLLNVYQAGYEWSADLFRWREILTGVLQGRFFIVERLDRDDILLIRAVGSGYRAFDASWSAQSAGMRIDEQPDIEYGAWLGKAYLSVLAKMTAQMEDVDAIIYRPQHGRRRFGYRRLLLPFAPGDGRQLLLSASIADPSIDLGIDQALEAS